MLHETKGDLRVGYSRRYKECFLRAKEQMRHERLGKVVGGTARVYNSRAQAFAILKRDPHATPVMDVLTYYVDLMCWFLKATGRSRWWRAASTAFSRRPATAPMT